MKYKELFLKGAYIIDLDLFEDNRGWFARTFDKDEFNKAGLNGEWLQLNHSFNINAGTLRGMHYQLPPFSEIKLVRCIAGSVYDVIIDLRKESDTYLKWYGIELSAENKKMIYIPAGFAHGFQTKTDNAELIYHHSQMYQLGFEKGIKYDDAVINIQWPGEVINISKKDEEYPYLTNEFEGLNF